MSVRSSADRGGPDHAGHQDPGLQPERTALSWTRTALSLMMVSVTMVRWSAEFPAVIMVLALLMLGLALIIMAEGRPRYERGVRGLAGEALEPNVFPVAVVTACMLLFGVTELILILVDPT